MMRFEVHSANAAEFDLGSAPVWCIWDNAKGEYIAIVWNQALADDWAKALNEKEQA